MGRARCYRRDRGLVRHPGLGAGVSDEVVVVILAAAIIGGLMLYALLVSAW
jgi:hypothetical protein